MANPNWVKGVSGNPSGRPKMYGKVAAEARKYCVEAIGVLVKIMRDGTTAGDRRGAARDILEWGLGGKPSTSEHAALGRSTKIDEMSNAELEDLIARGRAELERKTQ